MDVIVNGPASDGGYDKEPNNAFGVTQAPLFESVFLTQSPEMSHAVRRCQVGCVDDKLAPQDVRGGEGEAVKLDTF